MIRGQVFVYKYLVVFNSFENICHQSGFVHIQNILPFILSWALAKSLLIIRLSFSEMAFIPSPNSGSKMAA